MPHALIDIFLGVGVQIHHEAAAGLSDHCSAKARHLTPGKDGFLQLRGEDQLELIDTDTRKELIKGVNPAASVGLTVIAKPKRRLFDAIDIAVFGDVLRDCGSGSST